MVKLKKFLSKYIWIFIIIFSTPAVWALFVPGFFGASDDMHIAWLYEMDQVLKTGQLPPRFAPDLSFGFGYPLFNFLFPLPFYLGEVFHLLGLSFVDSVKGILLISIPLSALLMYKLLREFMPCGLSVAGAILYIYAPYRSVDIYVRGAIGEAFSFVFLPLITLSFIKLTTSKVNRLWVGIGALSLTALILTHNITTYMFFPFLILLGALKILFVSKDKKTAIFQSLAAFFLGILISSYFWLPAFFESNLMKYDTVFNFYDHFPDLRQLITPYWGYGASVPGPYDGMSFFIGISSLIILGAALFLGGFYFRKLSLNNKVILIWAVISLGVSVFMMNYRSAVVWQNLPFITFFQFPWRFLTMVTFLIPIFLLIFSKSRFKDIVAVVVVLLTLAINWSYFRPHDFLGRRDGYFIKRFIPVPEANTEYLQIQEEYLRLPKNTQKRPDRNFPRITVKGLGEVLVKKEDALNSKIEVNTSENLSIDYNKYYFPGWVAKLDGKKIDIGVGSPYGQLVLQVPPGHHLLEVDFQETFYRKLLDIISGAGLVLAIFIIFWDKFKRFLGYNIKDV